jgi:Flp pilus assembly protein TadG
MMSWPHCFGNRGAAAVEMALVVPLLCAILIGSVELGNFFYNEHILDKAVRDGARYAARQSFNYYGSSSACASPTDATMIGDVKALVRTSLLAASAGNDRFPDIQDSDISVTASCATSATGTSSTENMLGIYKGRPAGAPVVTVSAIVDYAPVIGAAFGFSGVGMKLNASEQAAVQGI